MHEKILLDDINPIKNYIKTEFISLDDIRKFKRKITQNLDQWVDEFISSIDSKTLEVNVAEFKNHLFPTINANIFLSHSHADEDEIIKFAILLERKGIEVFVDSVYWGYVANLKQKLDDKFAHQPETSTYNYTISSHNSQNVYLTLAACLTNMIDECELFIFYQTQNSLPVSKLDQQATYSPWIMHELETVSKIRFKESEFVQEYRMDSITLEEAQAKSSIEKKPIYIHSVEMKHLSKISGEKFCQCLKYSSTNKAYWFLNLYKNIMGKSVAIKNKGIH